MHRPLSLALLAALTCCRASACHPAPPAQPDDLEPIRDPLAAWELAPHTVHSPPLPASPADAGPDAGLDARVDAGHALDAGAAPSRPGSVFHLEDEDEDYDEEVDAGPEPAPTCGNDGGAIHCTADCWCSGPSFDATGPLMAVVARDNRAWALGSTFLRFDGRDWEEVGTGRHLFGTDGEAWSGGRRPFQGTALWPLGPEELWLARGTRFVRWDGRQFWGSESAPSQMNTVTALWGSGRDNLWAAGPGGTLVHHDSNGWSLSPSGTNETLTGIWGSGPRDVWAVGTSGTVLHFDGATWEPIDAGTSAWLTGVWVSPSGEVSISGQGGLWRGDRHGLHPVPLGRDASLSGVWGDGHGKVWAVGALGTILRFDRGGFASQVSGTTLTLRGVAGGGGRVYAVGDSGALLWHLEGG